MNEEIKKALEDALRLRTLESCILSSKYDVLERNELRKEATEIEERIRRILNESN